MKLFMRPEGAIAGSQKVATMVQSNTKCDCLMPNDLPNMYPVYRVLILVYRVLIL
jgi:hypothetical protein